MVLVVSIISLLQLTLQLLGTVVMELQLACQSRIQVALPAKPTSKQLADHVARLMLGRRDDLVFQNLLDSKAVKGYI